MRKMAKILVIVAACLAMGDVAMAVNPAMPFVSVSVPRGPIKLGSLWGPGMQYVSAEFDAHIVANCPFHVEASFEGFRHEKTNATISSEHLSVAINGNEVPVGTGRVPIAQSAQPTGASGIDVPVDLRLGLRRLVSYRAGRYRGNLVITVKAGS